MGLNQRRSNTNNRSTESEIVMQSKLVKSKMRFYRTKSTFVIVGLRIRLLIFMGLTAETDNGLCCTAAAYPIHGPLNYT